MIEKIFAYLHLAIEGKYIIVVTAFLLIVGGVLWPKTILFGSIIFVVIIIFFRDPVRNPTSGAYDIISPADGLVVDIEEVPLAEYNNQVFKRIGIFLSIFDVHVQRIPFAGEVILVKYSPGKHHAAFRSDAVSKNESNLVMMTTTGGVIGIKQIAGVLARRIVCKLVLHQKVDRADRLGMILFGSRVELYLPRTVELAIHKGKRVKAGHTIIARFINNP